MQDMSLQGHEAMRWKKYQEDSEERQGQEPSIRQGILMVHKAKMKKFYVEFNLGYVGYNVEAKNEQEAIDKANKIRIESDGYVSPNSELSEVTEKAK
jgi:hypothetical protein